MGIPESGIGKVEVSQREMSGLRKELAIRVHDQEEGILKKALRVSPNIGKGSPEIL